MFDAVTFLRRWLAKAWVIAVLATSAILILLWWLESWAGNHPPLLLFLVAVMVAAWFGATRAGLFATALSAMGSVFLLPAFPDALVIPPAARLQMLLLMGMGTLLAALIGRLRETQIQALNRSVEKQHRLERALQEQKETAAWFEWAVEAAPNGMIVMNQDGTILLANAQAERLFGYARNELAGQMIEILVPERFRSRHEQDRRRFLALPETRPMGRGRDLYGRCKSGREVPVEIGLSPISVAGEILVLASIVDISERKRLEASLREREARYSLLAENVPEILYTADPRGRYDYINQRHARFTGQPPEQALGEGWLDTVHPEDQARVQARWRESVSRGVPFDTEFRLRCHDGTYHWVCNHSLPIRDPHGRILKWFGVTADVDEQKKAQEVLREMDRRKDEFLAMLAHELRNPLAPIRNAVQVMRRLGPLEARLHWIREVIERQVTHLTHLVDELLDVSRITQGKLQLHPETVLLAKVVDHAVEAVRPLLEARRHRLTTRLPPEPVTLVADSARLLQILENLLGNAAKYTPDGGSIELVAERADSWVVLRVRDNGIGIAPDLLPQVFEPFVQADQSLDRSAGGLGIGLTLVRRLVELHGGTVEAFSEGSGRGSEFRVCLPVAGPGIPADSAPADPGG